MTFEVIIATYGRGVDVIADYLVQYMYSKTERTLSRRETNNIILPKILNLKINPN
jgi:hypothetical protein